MAMHIAQEVRVLMGGPVWRYRESYRDLLQTAERIMVMDAAAQNVESHLGEASRHCNSRLLDRKARNLKDFNEKMDARGTHGPYQGYLSIRGG
jgi:hypothetical protein